MPLNPNQPVRLSKGDGGLQTRRGPGGRPRIWRGEGGVNGRRNRTNEAAGVAA
jgi:hypothetical protein